RQATAAALVRAFTEIDPPGLSAAGYALRSFDLRAELPRMIPPVLVVTGSEDRIAPVRTAHELANDVPRGAVMTLEGVGHLAPAEDPSALAHLIREHTTPEGAPAPTTDHDREWERLLSAGAVTFESLASRQSPYELVQRPGLDEATRHALIICALATAGRLQELADHVRSAQRAGVGVGAIGEVLLLVAAYGGMPVARSAADVVARTLYGTRR
ncbi:carboxymuconolactone decarboxylase family protein, partial [Nocardioides massiliensis]